MKKLLVVLVTFMIICGTSCTATLHSANKKRIHNNAAYRSLYYHPYKKRSPKWYDRHQIYWFYRPASHKIGTSGTVIKHHKYKYTYQSILQEPWLTK